MKKGPLSSSSSLLILLIVSLITMAESKEGSSQPESSVHIVYTEKPVGLESEAEAEASHLKTLSTVLGSEEAARKALVYVYRTAANGFSAKLTPQQVEEISKLPGVLQVVPSQVYQLHSNVGGHGRMNK